MKKLIVTFLLMLGASAFADGTGVKNKFSLPHTESKQVKGVGRVTVTISAGEAVDVVYLDTSVVCLDKRYSYKVELPPYNLSTKSICDFTGLSYMASRDLMVIGYHILEPAGPSTCDTRNGLADTVEMSKICAELQPQ
jgi:hypothetical protein